MILSNFTARLYTASGIQDVTLPALEVNRGYQLVNELRIAEAIEAITGREMEHGDILNVAVINNDCTKYLNIMFFYASSFMGSLHFETIGAKKLGIH